MIKAVDSFIKSSIGRSKRWLIPLLQHNLCRLGVPAKRQLFKSATRRQATAM
jgi:hypothetical protein